VAEARAARTVLVVEDEPDLVTYLRTVLEDHGYVCLAAADGTEGLATAKARRPDLICLDVSLPDKSGVRLYRDLGEDPVTRGLPILLVTGISRDHEKLLAARRESPPALERVAKPIERDEFLEKVRATLRR
jgi:DNA-binding response OmpR family regulator